MAVLYLPPWRIDVTVRPGVVTPLAIASLARLAARALAASSAASPASLGLILSDDGELAALNVEHMGHEGPTDVLSFPLLPPTAFPAHPGRSLVSAGKPAPGFALPPGHRPHLGDIVISVERAKAQAPGSVADEVRQLVVHGVLHICGWDHARPAERDAMRALESVLLAAQ